MLNDVIFNNDISAFYDWNIVLTKAEIPPPEPKLLTVEIQGADGEIDLSEVLTNDIKYNNREIKLTFEVLNDAEYYETTKTVGKYLHGKQITFTLTHDDDYYYTGRAYINSWECVQRKGTIVVMVNADPYKYEITEHIHKIELNNETKEVVLINGRKQVCPTLDVTGIITLILNDTEYTLKSGKQRLLPFILHENENIVKFKGTGTVTVIHRRGEL